MNRAADLVWRTARALVGTVLISLEPVVQMACSLGVVLGLLACVIFELSPAGPTLPLGAVLAVSLSFGVILILYYGLLSFFVAD